MEDDARIAAGSDDTGSARFGGVVRIEMTVPRLHNDRRQNNVKRNAR